MTTIDYAAPPSPCFVLDEARLRANLERLAHVASESGAKIICALKGFALYASFPLVRAYLPGVTASSLAEALLGLEAFGGEIHAYCPAYIPADFDAIARLASHLTFNSVGEYARYRDRLAGASPGLRINPEYAEVETALYNPCVPGSRLGVTAGQLGGELPEGVEGLHMHTLCEKGSDTLARTLERVEAKFGALLDQVRWLNLGGGHAITREGYDTELLIQQIRQLRQRHPQLEEIVLEPGSAVAWETGELIATVLDVVESPDAEGRPVRTAMLDVSFSAHMPDCLEMPYRPRVLGARHDASPEELAAAPHRYHLGGQTCLAGDFMPDYLFEAPLRPGDRIVFWDMIHYTMVKTTTFNGVQLPSIAIWREQPRAGGQLEVVKRFGYEDYKRRV
ncbi:carboxynorspermidine decarboxylase [Pseudenhygromyxa sp. WMMC2535]|uniref:carboxynorspermidine decarboxylase n=1 Tax=Pseudenhygromyxa sp. WMMC2535 TaxID=2712867 RepID=UPI001553B1A1|nr:carboxynorspermidine decarboxylase [Pseudenhygromyxa sp. WMMC2535]NVB38897.1 carboxynorspermidine decarboxylase [Pseudenhygromyxa sp. WMMC2535]